MPVLLAVDTSGKSGSIALARIPLPQAATVQVLEVVTLVGGMFSAQLVPQIAELLARNNSGKEDIAAFAAASGPGSFTGLRVGLAAIKALAEVLQKPIAAVSLLEAIASSGPVNGRVLAALEAGRGDAYAGDYQVEPAALEENSHDAAGQRSNSAAPISNLNAAKLTSERLLSRQEFVEAAKTAPIVTPDSTLAELARRSGGRADQIAYPDTAVIAQLGWRKIRAGETVSPADLEANYIRRSDAEIFAKPK